MKAALSATPSATSSAGVIPPSLRRHPSGRPGRRPGNVPFTEIKPLYIVRSPFSQKVIPVLLSTAFLRDGYLWPGIQNNSCSLLSDTPERVTAQTTNMVRIVNRNLKNVWAEVNKSHSLAIPESRRVEGISVYVASIMSAEELMRERMKLLQ